MPADGLPDVNNCELFAFWAGDDIERWKAIEGCHLIDKDSGRGTVQSVYKADDAIRIRIIFGRSGEVRVFLPEKYTRCTDCTWPNSLVIGDSVREEAREAKRQKLEDEARKEEEYRRETEELRRKKEQDRLHEEFEARQQRKRIKEADIGEHLSSTSAFSGKKDVDQKALIRKVAKQRGIQYLVHFTRMENMPNICKYGLLPRSELRKRKIPHKWNDTKRLERRRYAISVSISFPNYLMFYKYRREERAARWAVLKISADVLWECKCAFYYTNAANKEFRGTDLDKFQTLEAFEGMFASEIKDVARDPSIPDCWTTDPQAEVLVFEPIPAERVLAVCVETGEDKQTLARLCPGARIEVCPELFRPRGDWERWKQQESENEMNFDLDDEDVPF
jgi:hypothetical protein